MLSSPMLLPVVVFGLTLAIFMRSALARRRLEFRARILELMAVACRGQVPISPLLAAAMREHTGARLQAVTTMHRTLLGGGSLADALAAAGEPWFATHIVEVARVAATTGRMGDALAALAVEDERTLEGRHRVQLALLYPVLLALMTVGLTGFTGYALSTEAWYDIQSPGIWAFTGIGLAVVAVVVWLIGGTMRRLDLRLGGRSVASARLLRLASILTDAGLPAPEALRRAAPCCRHHAVANAGRRVAARIEEGELSIEAWLPLRLPRAIALRLGAVRPTRLHATMAELAARLLHHHQRARERTLRWLQPVSIAVVAGLVLLRYMAVMRVVDASRQAVELW